MNKDRPFRLTDLLPFEKPVGHDQAATFLEGISEAGLFGDRFRFSIDELVADLWIIGPRGDKPPLDCYKLLLSVVDYGGYPLRWGYVVARLKVGGNLINAEFSGAMKRFSFFPAGFWPSPMVSLIFS